VIVRESVNCSDKEGWEARIGLGSDIVTNIR